MGLFDTFIFDIPLHCSYCGKQHLSVQSKNFNVDLLTFNPGDRVTLKDESIIREEDLHCFADDHPKGEHYGDYQPLVYLAIENGVYLGARPTVTDAERLFETDVEPKFDRG